MPDISSNPLARPDGQFEWTDALRAIVVGYRRSAYVQGYGAFIGADTLAEALRADKAPSLGDLSALINRSLSSFGIGKETVRKGYYPDLRKLLPVWMAYRDEGVLDVLLRYPDDPFLLAYTTQLVLRWPVMRELGRRLLWSTTEDKPRSFRLSEDYTMVDVQDAPVVLAEGASVHLAHPMHLDATTLAAWIRSWADYELLQPFEQLARRVYRLDDDCPATRSDVPWARGRPVAVGSFMGLLQGGWTRMQDGSAVYGLRLACTGGEATIHLQGAIDISAPLSTPVLTIQRLELDAQLEPLACSEVLRTVDRLARS